DFHVTGVQTCALPILIGLVGYSAPIFWLGLLGLLIFYSQLGWVAGPGRLDVTYGYMLTPVTGMVLVDSALAGDWAVFRNAVSHKIGRASCRDTGASTE